jgi:microcystin-dependent protein
MPEWTDTGGDTDNVPAGTVVMWTGDPSNTPGGWTLCDGTNPDGPDSEVPDLRNRFIVGAGDEYNIGETGGKKEVQLNKNELPKHSHNLSNVVTGYTGADYTNERGYMGDVGGSALNTEYGGAPTDTAGDDQPHENRPPYYALAYIVRLGGG